MSAVETLPPFRLLIIQLGGFEPAYKKWCKVHRADERVAVDAWDKKVFDAIHAEVAQRCRNQRIPYVVPNFNFAYDVTPTGGRLVIQDHFDPRLGLNHPIDPPADELLRLSWILAYWEARQEKSQEEFERVKSRLKTAAQKGSRDPAKLAELQELRRNVKFVEAKVEEVAAEVEPLLPRSLRDNSQEDLAIKSAIAQQKSSFDRELDRISL